MVPLVGQEVKDGEDLAMTDDQSGVGNDEVSKELNVGNDVLEQSLLVI